MARSYDDIAAQDSKSHRRKTLVIAILIVLGVTLAVLVAQFILPSFIGKKGVPQGDEQDSQNAAPPPPPQDDSLSDIGPINQSELRTPLDSGVQDAPETGSLKEEDPPTIRLGGIRKTDMSSVLAKVNGTTPQLIPITDFNASIPIRDFVISFYKSGDSASVIENVTNGRYVLYFEIFATPPEAVKMSVDINSQHEVVGVYNAKLLRWQPVYIELGDSIENNRLRLKLTFLEDTPLAAAAKSYDRNAYVRNINVIRLGNQ